MRTTIPTALVAALLATVLAALPAAAVSLIATVGAPGDSACTHHDLQQAIDDLSAQPADQRTIRVARAGADDAVFHLPTVRVGTDMTIIGGHPNCSSLPTPGIRTVLDGLSSSVIRIENEGGPRARVRLVSLSLEGGEAPQGGGLYVAGDFEVELVNVLVLDNDGFAGGGIFLDGSEGATLRLIDSGVNGNRGSGRGGGIACEGGATIVAEGGGVGGNTAGGVDGVGGGLALDGCTTRITGPFTISGNRAGRGGGIHATNGAVATLEGTATGAVRLVGNVVEVGGTGGNGFGGGIHVSGDGTILRASATVFDRNRSADGSGGALLVGIGAVALVDRGFASGECEEVGSCSVMRDNEALGGPAASVVGGSLTLGNVVLRGNRSTLATGAGVVDANLGDGAGQLRIVGSTFDANSAPALVRAVGPGVVQLDHVTAAGNFDLDHVLFVGRNGVGAARIELRNAIVQEPIAVPLVGRESGGVVSADCSLVHVVDGLAPGSVVFQVDPRLADVDRGDLHLTAASPAVDLCLPLAAAGGTDLDLQPRGFDVPNEPEHRPGSFADAGADELSTVAGVFFESFERGDTSRWSAATPLLVLE